jgi:acetyl esterase
MALDPQARALLDYLDESGAPTLDQLDPDSARKVYERGCEVWRGNPPTPHAVRSLSIAGPACELHALLYQPSEDSNLPLLVFFHGGGFTIGSSKSHDAVCRSLCVEAKCLVVSVDYRLAPEAKFPAAVEDAWAALNWVVNNAAKLGADVDRIAIGGDSAGANLSAVVCLMAKEAGGPTLVHQLLIYPGTDTSRQFDSHQKFARGYRLTADLLAWFYHHYFDKNTDTAQWRASPLNAPDHSGLPPAFILSAGFDPLQDENRAYADKLAASGVPVQYSHYAGMIHGFITMAGVFDQTRIALSECAEQLRLAFRT